MTIDAGGSSVHPRTVIRILLLIFLFVGYAALAQSRSAKDKPASPGIPISGTNEEIIEKAKTPELMIPAFFLLLQKGELDAAYVALTKGSRIAERPEDLTGLKTKTKEAIETFGPIQGFEQIEAKMIGSRLVRRTCVSYGRDFPLRWRFYFYQTGETWRLIDLRVDDRLAGIFGESEDGRPAPELR